MERPRVGQRPVLDVALDGRGGVYVVGRTAGRGGDAAILRYSSDGRLTWSRRFDTGSGWQDDARLARGVLGGDGVYVVVESWSGAAYRTRVLRYSGEGARVDGDALAGHARERRRHRRRRRPVPLRLGRLHCRVGLDARRLVPPAHVAGRSGCPATPRSHVRRQSTSRATIVWTTDVSDGAAAPEHGSVSASSYAPFAQRWGGDPGLVSPYSLRDVAGTESGGAIAVGLVRWDGADQGFVAAPRRNGRGGLDAAHLDRRGRLRRRPRGDHLRRRRIGGRRTGTVFSALHYVPASGLTWRHDYDARPAGRALAFTSTSDGGAYVAGWGRRPAPARTR